MLKRCQLQFNVEVQVNLKYAAVTLLYLKKLQIMSEFRCLPGKEGIPCKPDEYNLLYVIDQSIMTHNPIARKHQFIFSFSSDGILFRHHTTLHSTPPGYHGYQSIIVILLKLYRTELDRQMKCWYVSCPPSPV